jgi:hypothetical protein
VLQRSTHESAVDVPAIPATVQPGETVDWPIPISGFEPVPDPPKSKKAAPSARAGEEPQS